MAERIFAVMESDRTCSVQEVAGALPGVDIQNVRSELNRQSRRGALEHVGHGLYRKPTTQGGADDKRPS